MVYWSHANRPGLGAGGIVVLILAVVFCLAFLASALLNPIDGAAENRKGIRMILILNNVLVLVGNIGSSLVAAMLTTSTQSVTSDC